MTTWKDVATSEHLLDGLSDDQVAMLNRVFGLLPDDTTKLVFLRYANESGILASSPHMTSILLILALMSRMAASELEAVSSRTEKANGNFAELVERVNEAIRAVGESAIQIVDRTTHLKIYSERAADKMDAIASSLPQKFEEVVGSLEGILRAAAEAKVEAAQTASFDASVRPKIEKVMADLDVIAKDLSLIAEKLEPVAISAKRVINAEPWIIAGVKLNRVTAMIATATLVVGIVLGGILGFVIPRSGTITGDAVRLTPDMVRTFDRGAALEKVWPHLSASEKAAFGRELAAPPSNP